jgi:hypothetical protein
MGGFTMTIPIRFILYISLHRPHHLSSSTPSSPQLKQLQEVSLFYFIYEVHQPHTITVISFIRPSPSLPTYTHTIPILQSFQY